MIKTPLSTVIGGAFWTPGATILGSSSQTLTQLIKSLFANNEQGFFYDPNDLSTMYQDAVGIIPVTAAGQPVGLMKDKSGRNNHAYQTVSASRPILQRNAATGAYYLAFDGVDDFMQTNSIDFTATDKVSLFAGVRKLSDATTGVVCELSNSTDLNKKAFALFAPSASGANHYNFRSFGTLPSTSAGSAITKAFPAPNSAVLAAKGGISSDTCALTINSTVKVEDDGDQGTGNYGNYPLYIGRRGGTSLPFSGHIYSLIGIGKLVLSNEAVDIEKELAKRVGATLNV